jgi:hypothetical protein
MNEKRKHRRLACRMKAVVTRTLPDRKTVVNEFGVSSLSSGGVFIMAEDLSLFDLNEEIHVIVEDGEDRFYDGRARVMRSARVFAGDKKLTMSGFGLMFIDVLPDYFTRIDGRVSRNNPVIL